MKDYANKTYKPFRITREEAIIYAVILIAGLGDIFN